MSDATYQVEYSKTDRASCKDTKCKTKIGKGVLRIGKETASPFGDDTMLNWYHASCAFRALTRAKSTTKKIEEMDDLVGHEGINSTDKKYLARLIAGEKLWTESGWTEPSGAKSSATEKKTAKKRKASPSPTPKKKKGKSAKTYLECSGKFWEISVLGDETKIRFGKVDCDGATQIKEWGSHEVAVKQMEKQIRAKKRKGYKEEGEDSEEEGSESEESEEEEEDEEEEEEDDDWQWKDEDNKWHSYSDDQQKGIRAAIRAKSIFYKFDVGSNSYRVHLKKQYQVNIATGVQRNVRVK